MLKKTFITCIMVVAMTATTTAFGQANTVGDKEPTRYLASTLKQNWFISVDGNIDWWKGSDKNPAGNYTAVQWGKPSFGGSLSFGKWITHNIGVSLAYDVHGGKSYINGLYARNRKLNFLYYGTFNYDENFAITNWIYTYTPGDGDFPTETGADENGYYNTSFMYRNFHADVLLSPIDLIQGYYNSSRVYTPVIYAGMGIAVVNGDTFLIPNIIHNNQNNHNNGNLSHNSHSNWKPNGNGNHNPSVNNNNHNPSVNNGNRPPAGNGNHNSVGTGNSHRSTSANTPTRVFGSRPSGSVANSGNSSNAPHGTFGGGARR